MSTRMRRVVAKSLGLGLLAALWLAISIAGFAQSDNTQISGFVKDTTGAVIAGAKITAKNETNGLERSATSNGEGYYIITQLPSGFYTMSAEASGFKLYKETGKKLDPNVPAKLDVSLQAGQVSEVVNIMATTVGVQTESAAITKLVDEQTIKNTMINGRNPLFLAITKPGVIGSNLGGNSFGLTQAGLNINGGRTQDILITFDGAVGVRTRSNGTSIGTADLDATQEVQILTANYNAEYGRSAGGQIRIVTKSGTHDFHGTFYEYFRNSALNANTWTRKTNTTGRSCDLFPNDQQCKPSPFRYNQYGYTLSGPVLLPFTEFNRDRSKLFWSFSQEWVKQRTSTLRTLIVPTLKMRQGDFSELAVANPFFSSPRFIKDPLKSGPCNSTVQTGCFSDGGIINKIPASRLSPNGMALLRALPEPIPGF